MSKHWNGSTVWDEFSKIAADEGLITSDLTPAQEHVEKRQKDVPKGDDYTREKKTEDYDVTEGTGKDLVEKAHPEVLKIFLQIFDEGKIQDARGKLIYFSNITIIMTSNAIGVKNTKLGFSTQDESPTNRILCMGREMSGFA